MRIDNSVNNSMFDHFKSLSGITFKYNGFSKKNMSFKFAKIVWEVIEDTYDGNRSQLDWVVYGDQNCNFHNNFEEDSYLEEWNDVKTKEYEVFCGWVLRKSNNGEVILMIGTDYTDEYYPATVLDTYS